MLYKLKPSKHLRSNADHRQPPQKGQDGDMNSEIILQKYTQVEEQEQLSG